MHRHFYHPYTDKMYAVIKRVYPTTTYNGVNEILYKVGYNVYICQWNSSEPYRSRVSLPTVHCVFNRIVAM